MVLDGRCEYYHQVPLGSQQFEASDYLYCYQQTGLSIRSMYKYTYVLGGVSSTRYFNWV